MVTRKIPPNHHQEGVDANTHHRGTVGDETADRAQTPSPMLGRLQKRGMLGHYTKWPGSDLPRKTEYMPVEEKIRTAGRGFGIFHEMWRAYGIIIDKGIGMSTTNTAVLQDVYVFIIPRSHQTSP